MAKSVTLALGIDIGNYALKAVLMQKKGSDRFAVTNFGYQLRDASVEPTPEELAANIKLLFKQVGSSGKECGVAISKSDALLRILDQPETPPKVLRDALRLNGLALLNQDCHNFVLDCDFIETTAPLQSQMGTAQRRYLVGGIPRVLVSELDSAFLGSGISNVGSLQLSPIAVLNAFEFAQPDVYNQQAFFLVDIGHTSSTMMIGVKRELMLVRNIDFGGRLLLETLHSLSGETPESILEALNQDEEITVENTRMALASLTREIASSIGFFEGRREEPISQVWFSGGIAKSKTFLRVLTEELRMPCNAWNALERCEVNVPAARQEQYNDLAMSFNVACGAAAELLTR